MFPVPPVVCFEGGSSDAVRFSYGFVVKGRTAFLVLFGSVTKILFVLFCLL